MIGARLQGRESTLFAGALVVGAFFVSFGVLHYGIFTKNVLLDTPLYERYGDAIVHRGHVPYRDFAVEYPPGALVPFIAPSLIAARGDFSLYQKLFEGLMLACGALGTALVAYTLAKQRVGAARLAAGTLLAGLAPLALGPVVLSRFDLWPALLTLAALTALVVERPRLGLGLLGAGVVAKVYPVVLVPVAVVYVWRTKGRREALVSLGQLVGVIAAVVVPFLVVAPHGVWASISGQLGRPLQIESLGAGILLSAHQLVGLRLDEITSHGSDNLAGGAASTFAAIQSVLSVVTIVTLWIAFARGPATRERLLRYATALVCAFIVCNKVLSPQYLIWLIALVPLVRGRRGAIAAALFVLSMVLTQLWFPEHYINLVYNLDARASWYVLARDVALVALLATLVWPAERARRAGIAMVAGLASASVVVAAVGAATSAPARAAVHNGLLAQSGIAGRCGARRETPPISPGTVAYGVATFPGPSRASCVTVELRTEAHIQLFSAAYRGTFQPTSIRAGYLGDAGKCTNVAGFSSGSSTYSVRVARGGTFAVEVENCGSGSSVPPFTLDIHEGGTKTPALYKSAAARQTGNLVTVTWTASRLVRGTRFTVYRQQGLGSLVPVPAGIAVKLADGSYRFVDGDAPLRRPLLYWVLARAPNGAWSWHGPLSTTA